MTKEPDYDSSLNSLFAFFQVADPSSAGTSFVPCDERPDEFVVPNGSHGFLVYLVGPSRRIELWPIDLGSSD